MQKGQISNFDLNNNALIINLNRQKRLAQKNQLISILEQKNEKLHKQIQKISKLMQQSCEVQQKNKKQLKRQNIIQSTNDTQILNRQLNNCYKKIKLYSYEVDKLKGKSVGNDATSKVFNIQNQLKQKKQIQERLKQQLHNLHKEIVQNTKKLSSGSHQQQIQKQLKNKSDELKFLREMIKQYQSRELIKQKNLKTQYNHIKKIQKQYVESGGSTDQLQSIKQKAVRNFQEGRLKPSISKQLVQNSYYQRFAKNSPKSLPSNIPNLPLLTTVNPQTQAIEDRSKSHYQSLVNQLNVLQKLNKRYQKQFQQSEKNLGEIEGKSELTKNRLQKLQKEIDELNSLIKLKKTCIVAENMRPIYKRSTKSVSITQDEAVKGGQAQVRQNKRKRNIINLSTIQPQLERRLFNN